MSKPLPSAPNLEFERKEAKALLKQIRAADAEALSRVHAMHAVALRDRRPEEIKLADAQHVIAREYGFASWPRLVEYFEELERHRNAPRYNSEEPLHYGAIASDIVLQQQQGNVMVARQLAHYVPRFFALPINEIRGKPITTDEARLVVARDNRRASWDELMARLDDTNAWKARVDEERGNTSTPLARARTLISESNVEALDALLREFPELPAPSLMEREWKTTLGRSALGAERRAGTAEARRLTHLLEARGVDIQRELNESLLGFPWDRAQPDAVQWYLQRGANPNWVPDNGIPVLEHAIVRFEDSECIDLIAARVTPRRALWISAALGDANGVQSFFARNGKLTAEGRLNRPDMVAMGSPLAFLPIPPCQDADDLEIMFEAFQVAGFVGRWNTMDTLLEAGLPIDHAPMGIPLVLMAFANTRFSMAEYLVRRGADVNREWPPHGSAREFADEYATSEYNRAKGLRLLEIIG